MIVVVNNEGITFLLLIIGHKLKDLLYSDVIVVLYLR